MTTDDFFSRSWDRRDPADVRPYLSNPAPTELDHEPLDLITMVVATVSPEAILEETSVYRVERDGRIRVEEQAFGLGAEHLAILRRCHSPRSIADLAAYLGLHEDPWPQPVTYDVAARLIELSGPPGLPVNTVRALLGDLLNEGLVRFQQPELDDPQMYRGLLDDLRRLWSSDHRG